MNYTGLIAEYRREADRAYRKARKEARDAERQYKRSVEYANHAAWLLRYPEMQDETLHSTPATWERMAAACEKMGDVFLRASFRETERARFYRGLARSYAAM